MSLAIITFIGHDVINERIIELLSNLSSTDSLIGLCTLDTKQFYHLSLVQCLVIKGLIKGKKTQNVVLFGLEIQLLRVSEV